MSDGESVQWIVESVQVAPLAVDCKSIMQAAPLAVDLLLTRLRTMLRQRLLN